LIEEQIRAHVRPPATLLDMGCGDMPYKTTVEQMGITYIGADLDDSADLRIGDDGRVPLEAKSMDALLSVQVLEHVRDIPAYCGELRRLLTDDGTLFLSTHGTWLYHPHPEDHRRWTNIGLVAELEGQGFAVEEILPVVGPLATTTLIRLTGFVFVLGKVPLFGKPLGKLLGVIMNLRALLEDKLTPESIRTNDACVYFVRARKQLRQ
jgi:SAM-dependent methyltransferase